MNKIITNTNGYQYEVLDSKTNYTLLVNIKTGEYVVAWILQKWDVDKYCWASGTYFESLISAKKCFKNK